LTAQNEIQSLEIQNNQVMLGGMGGIAILLVVSTIAMYSRKNYKLKVFLAQEKEAQQKLRFKSVIEGEEKERKRIAQDLHDGLGQLLSTARLNVSVLEDEILDDNSTTLNNSLKLIDDAVSEVRSISHNMMPNALISIVFEAALKEQVHLINDAGKVHVKLLLPEENLDLEESKAISLIESYKKFLTTL
jgi:signal transduction histidine kinase